MSRAKPKRAGRCEVVLSPEAAAALAAILSHYHRAGMDISAGGAIRFALLRLAEQIPSPSRPASGRERAALEVRA